VSGPEHPLLETDADPDPLRQFLNWFAEALAADIDLPEAAALATADLVAAPSVRMVLVKQVDERGFVFFSNYESRKGRELATNPRVALLFHWQLLGRQVRIEGAAERTPAEESARYVRSRPRGSQLSALASPQSRPVESREVLEECVAELAARHVGADVPLPESWGGYRVSPESYEFWQHRADRLHDRLRYVPEPGGGWRIERLAP
jgi:pyridoxamine 5'-phosphate oxidase